MTVAQSQVVVDGVNINELDIEFCEIVAESNFWGTKAKIKIDYGQPGGSFGFDKVTDKDGKPLKVNTTVGALNYMFKNGWDFVTSYTIGDASKGYVYHFLLRKISPQ
ncbi:MAG: hypothetical protein Kow0027_22630 [Saprospiraceae bacterium]